MQPLRSAAAVFYLKPLAPLQAFRSLVEKSPGDMPVSGTEPWVVKEGCISWQRCSAPACCGNDCPEAQTPSPGVTGYTGQTAGSTGENRPICLPLSSPPGAPFSCSGSAPVPQPPTSCCGPGPRYLKTRVAWFGSLSSGGRERSGVSQNPT